MNDQDITAAEGFGKDAVRLDEGHVVGQGGIPDRLENPGLPPHVPRGADLSEAAAKRAALHDGLSGLPNRPCRQLRRN